MTDDLISRADAIKAICEDGTWLERQGCYEITMAERKQRDADILSGIPSAQPKRGEWIAKTENYHSHWVCSICGGWALLEYNEQMCLSNFCPLCGARMKGADDE